MLMAVAVPANVEIAPPGASTCPTSMVVQELWWWLTPEARGKGAGQAMYKTIESWAIAKGAVALFMIALEDERADKMASLYARKGFRPMERTYIREVA